MSQTAYYFAALTVGLFMFAETSHGDELRAGVARVDLTPPLELKAPLGGYGERMNRPAVGVHDRIFAKAIVLTDGKKKFALVTADLLGFSPPVKQAVIDRLADDSWKNDCIMLLPSHSHTSIEMNAINPLNTFNLPQIGIHNPQLFDLTVENLARAIREAEQELVPVMAATTVRNVTGFSRNRRTDGGSVDPALTVTRIDTQRGNPLAVLVNFTAHPTFMSAEDMSFSGGWPGHLQRTMESLIGKDVTVMYYNGAQGDQSPVPRPDSGSSHWERAECYGRDLALLAHRSWRSIRPRRITTFEFHRQEIRMPERMWHPNFQKTGGAEYGLTEDLLAEMLPAMFPQMSASISFRLDDLVIVGIPGELAAKMGLEIKSQAKFATGAKYAAIGGLADEWISYILTAQEYQRGGYEASVSFYGPELGERIVSGALEGVRQLGK